MTEAKRIATRAEGGLTDLYERYSVWLGDRLVARVGRTEADDVVQETYLRIAPLEGPTIRHPKAFLLKIAMNLIRDGRRRERAETRTLGGLDPKAVEAASQAEQVLLKQIILTMPPLYRDVFILSRFGGMTYPEIAASKGVSVQTVQWRMSRALEYCEARLGG